MTIVKIPPYFSSVRSRFPRGVHGGYPIIWALIFKSEYLIWLVKNTKWSFSNEILDLIQIIEGNKLSSSDIRKLLIERGLL